jgi:hypothetical protein
LTKKPPGSLLTILENLKSFCRAKSAAVLLVVGLCLVCTTTVLARKELTTDAADSAFNLMNVQFPAKPETGEHPGNIVN